MHQHQLCKLVCSCIKITHSPLSLNLSRLPSPSIFSTSHFYAFSVRRTLIFYWKWCSQLQLFFSWNFIEWFTLRLKLRGINWISSYTIGWIKKTFRFLFIYLFKYSLPPTLWCGDIFILTTALTSSLTAKIMYMFGNCCGIRSPSLRMVGVKMEIGRFRNSPAKFSGTRKVVSLR